MFLNTSVAKKMFKRAFNSTGLVVARPNIDTIYIAGSGYEIEMDYENMPFKLKAAVIELIGEIPQVGKQIAATKKSQKTENCILPFSVYDEYLKAKDFMVQCPVVIARPYFEYQLFQNSDMKIFVGTNRELLSMIDIREVDFENEGMPSGPCMIRGGVHLYWHNVAGTLKIALEEFDNDAKTIVSMLHDLEVKRGD